MRAIKQIVIGMFIGLASIVAHAFLSMLAMPKTDMFLIAANHSPETNPLRHVISKIYIKFTEDKTCSMDAYFKPGRLVIEDARFLFAAMIAEWSTDDEDYRKADKKIIMKELYEASKYCKNSIFNGDIDGVVSKYPPPVYVILSKDIDYFEILMRNCVSFDKKYINPNNVARTPRELLEKLISHSEGKDRATYTEMMNSLHKNDAHCSGR